MDPITLLLGASLAIVVLIAVILLLRASRFRRQAQEERERNQGRRDRASVDAAYRAMRARGRANQRMMTFLLTALIGGGLIGVGVWDWQLINFGAEWPLVAGAVSGATTRQEAVPRQGGFDVTYHIRIEYLYQVEGVPFGGNFDVSATNDVDYQALSARYARGAVLNVWHHPRFHEISFTYAFGRLYNIALIAIGSAFALIALWALVTAIGFYGQTRQRA